MNNGCFIYEDTFLSLLTLIDYLLKNNIKPANIKNNSYFPNLLDQVIHLELKENKNIFKEHSQNDIVKLEKLDLKDNEIRIFLDMLYEDKFRGLVSDEMYKRIANETEVLLTKSRTEIKKLKAEEKAVQNKTDDIKEYEDKIKVLIDLENPTRELMQAIIDKIVIDKDKNIEIIYKFSILNNI